MFIDTITEAELFADDVRARFMPLIVSDLDNLSPSDLEGAGVARATLTAQPAIEDDQTLVEGWIKAAGSWTQAWSIAGPSLSTAKLRRNAEIMAQYQAKKLTAVFSLGHWWRGGFESAQGIKGAHDLVEAAGGNAITLFDVDGNDGTYSLTDAMQIAFDVGVAYQTVFGIKEYLLRTIRAAESVEAVKAVSWPE